MLEKYSPKVRISTLLAQDQLLLFWDRLIFFNVHSMAVFLDCITQPSHGTLTLSVSTETAISPKNLSKWWHLEMVLCLRWIMLDCWHSCTRIKVNNRVFYMKDGCSFLLILNTTVKVSMMSTLSKDLSRLKTGNQTLSNCRVHI